MRKINLKSKVIIVILVFGSWIITPGCAERSTDPLQEDLRAGDNQVVLDTVLGNPCDHTIINNIVRDSFGDIFFTGQLNNEYVVGQLKPNGDLPWISCVSSKSRNITLSTLDEGGLIVSSSEPDLNTYSTDGVLLHELNFDDSSGKSCIYAAEVTSVNAQGATFIVIGEKLIDGVRFPILVSIDISQYGTMAVNEDTIFSGFPNSDFYEMAIDTTETPTVYYIIRGIFSSLSDEFVRSTIIAMSENHEILWSDDLTGIKGYNPCACDITLIDGGVAIAGYSTLQKNSGGEWPIFLVRAFESDGTVRWTQSKSISDYADNYYACTTNGNILFVAGDVSYFCRHSTTRVYGYGILSKIDVSTGEYLGHIISGSPDYCSGNNDVLSYGETVYCAGLTEYYIENGSSRGWYSEVDSSDPSVFQITLEELALPQSDGIGDVYPQSGRKSIQKK